MPWNIIHGLQHIFIAHNNIPYWDATLFAQHQHPLRYEPAAGLAQAEAVPFTAAAIDRQAEAVAVR